jgi:hypothetical protein
MMVIMKRASIALAISIGLFVVGLAVCTPGICGCVSWLGIPDLGRMGAAFIYMALAGVLGIIISCCWLFLILILKYLRRTH